MSNHLKNLLLVGAGYMAREYAKVLTGLGISFDVVCRSKESALKFEQETGHIAQHGGIKNYLKSVDALPEKVIVAVQQEYHAEVCRELLNQEVKHILLEKPGSVHLDDFHMLTELARKQRAEVSVAYNRRFYASTRAARNIIEEDGGVSSFCFEFTEWLHRFPDFQKNSEYVWRLFLGNSSHVIDLAFHLGGKPKEMNSFCQPSLENESCHTAFAGAGITASGALFNYMSNWEAPGRWGVEILTHKHRLIFRPLEKLQVQTMDSVQIYSENIDYNLDMEYKPGLFLETKAFYESNEDHQYLCSISEQSDMSSFYKKMEQGTHCSR